MLFGTEFTFTQEAIHALDTDKPTSLPFKTAEGLIDGWVSEVASLTLKLNKTTMQAKVTRDKLNGNKGPGGDKRSTFTYTLPSGAEWWWRLDIDYGCLETQAMPTTIAPTSGDNSAVEDNRAIQMITARHIFEVAPRLGLAPHGEIGGGHLSLDRATTFGDNARFFRNFLVLYANDPGAWRREDPDDINAPMIDDLKTAGKAAFRNVIAAFDQRYAGPTANRMTANELADELRDKVFLTKHFSKDPGSEAAKKKRNEQPAHYQATNVEHMTSTTAAPERRIEMRRFDAQTSLDDLLADLKNLTDLVVASRRPGLVPLTL